MPEGHGKAAESTVQSQGVAAFLSGADIRDNPHQRNSPNPGERLAAMAWTRGWTTAWTTARRAKRAKKGPTPRH